MKIRIVSPYIYSNQFNFKFCAYRVLESIWPETKVKGWYPRLLHGVLFRIDLFPTLYHCTDEARLVLVEPVSLYFDTGFSVLRHEVIPFIWDCWPCYYDKMEAWFNKHKTRTAIFTSRMEMEEMKCRCPQVNMLWCPEAVDGSLYKEGKLLKDRNIDLLEFGRSNERVLGQLDTKNINHVCTLVDGKFIYSNDELYDAMGDSKITVCLPKSMTHPDIAQGIETLTQRYWEAMLSRMVIVGHAPQELIDICGYNPVIELDDNPCAQINDILHNIEDYQSFVDKNRETALRLGTWKVRMASFVKQLEGLGMYNVHCT